MLAVDVSLSMEPDWPGLRRQGFVEAFRAPEVHEAIHKGMLGRIAVTYVEWAGSGYQQVVVPWTIVEHPAGGHAFAARLAQVPIQRFGSNPSRVLSISDSGSFGQAVFRSSGR